MPRGAGIGGGRSEERLCRDSDEHALGVGSLCAGAVLMKRQAEANATRSRITAAVITAEGSDRDFSGASNLSDARCKSQTRAAVET